jgi:hypothetical protein
LLSLLRMSVYRLWVSAKCVVLLGILLVWFYFNGPWRIIQYYQAFYLYNLSRFTFLNKKKFEDTVNINYRLPIKVYYRICTLRHIRIEINHWLLIHLVKCVSSAVHNVNGQHIGKSDYWFSVTARLPWSFKSTYIANQNSTCHENIRE